MVLDMYVDRKYTSEFDRETSGRKPSLCRDPQTIEIKQISDSDVPVNIQLSQSMSEIVRALQWIANMNNQNSAIIQVYTHLFTDI